MNKSLKARLTKKLTLNKDTVKKLNVKSGLKGGGSSGTIASGDRMYLQNEVISYNPLWAPEKLSGPHNGAGTYRERRLGKSQGGDFQSPLTLMLVKERNHEQVTEEETDEEVDPEQGDCEEDQCEK